MATVVAVIVVRAQVALGVEEREAFVVEAPLQAAQDQAPVLVPEAA